MNNRTSDCLEDWNSNISQIHFEYYCKHKGISPRDYNEFCILGGIKPETLIDLIERTQLSLKNVYILNI